MKLFLALALLLSGGCIYGMEDNSKNQLKKSQELPKDCFFYYDSPCGGNPTIIYGNEFYKEGIYIKLPQLATSQSLVPSQLLGIVAIKKLTNE